MLIVFFFQLVYLIQSLFEPTKHVILSHLFHITLGLSFPNSIVPMPSSISLLSTLYVISHNSKSLCPTSFGTYLSAILIL